MSSTKPKKKPAIHPWRVCPYGEHQVITHPLHIPPSKKHPNGITTRHWHCAKNPSKKDQLYPCEIEEIANQNFSKVKNKPCALPLRFGKNGTAFDSFIAGWTQYWNDVLTPTELLDPNFVKALIASESSFKPILLADPENSDSARGLTQILNKTRVILGNQKGEITDHYITVTKKELNDPNTNICAGIRWLFHKKELTSNKLGRPATWQETLYDYKGASKVSKKRAEEIMKKFNEYYQDYQKCGK